MTMIAQVASGSQTCTTCGVTKTLSKFARNPRARIGMFRVCDECRGSAISIGRKKAKAARAAAMPQVSTGPLPFRRQTPEQMLRTLRRLADNAAGMAALDQRIEDHANDLDTLHGDLAEVLS